MRWIEEGACKLEQEDCAPSGGVTNHAYPRKPLPSTVRSTVRIFLRKCGHAIEGPR